MRKGDPSAAVTLNASPATALLTSGPKVDEMNVDFQWGGCSDNVHFGYKKSRDFFDALHRKRSDIKTLVKSHNNDAGRLVSNTEYLSVEEFQLKPTRLDLRFNKAL